MAAEVLENKVNRILRSELKTVYKAREDLQPLVAMNQIDQISLDNVYLQKFILLALIEQGISTELFMSIVESTGFTLKDWAHVTNIPYRTIQRYAKEQKLLKPIFTEKVFEFSEVLKKGKEVFGSDAKFEDWLTSTKYIFGNKRPLELLSSSIGKDMVMKELNRIDHGLFA